jgi:hypothetical protein
MDPQPQQRYVGSLRGLQVELPGVSTVRLEYTKRPRDEYNRLRRDFDSKIRPAWVKQISNNPEKVKQLKEAGFTESDLKLMRDGNIPDKWKVHHKIPLDDGGTNDPSNFILMKNEPFHKALTNAQNDMTRGMQVGQTDVFAWPMPSGLVYPSKDSGQ